MIPKPIADRLDRTNDRIPRIQKHIYYMDGLIQETHASH